MFSMFTVWHGLFSLVLIFSTLRIDAPPHPQYRVSEYTFFKTQNQSIQFPLLCTKLSKDKRKILFFQRLVVPGPIYRPAVPSEQLQFGQFIGQACQNNKSRGLIYLPNMPITVDKICGPIYRSTAAKWLKWCSLHTPATACMLHR